jgi:hypothetical protein
MQAWVQSQLLWNPNQDDRALIREFLQGYYGPAAKPIQAYLDLMAKAAQPETMGIWVGPDADFFRPEVVLRAEQLWQEAERLAASDPEVRWRVRLGHLPIRYVVLSRWTSLRSEAARKKLPWTLPESRRAVADAWIAVATGPGPKGWSAITHMNESGLRPERWVERFQVDPAPIVRQDGDAAKRLPADLVVPAGADVVQVQDDHALLYGEGNLSEIRPDAKASDGIACRMPGTHHEWAFQLSVKKLPEKVLKGRWRVYAVVRVEPGKGAVGSKAFSAGVYSQDLKKGLGGVEPTVDQAGTEYRSYLLTTTELSNGCYVWVAPPGGGAVDAVWVDRVVLVRE